MANTGTVASLSCAPWSAASHAAHTAARRPSILVGSLTCTWPFSNQALALRHSQYRSHRGPAPVGLRRVHADQGDECGSGVTEPASVRSVGDTGQHRQRIVVAAVTGLDIGVEAVANGDGRSLGTKSWPSAAFSSRASSYMYASGLPAEATGSTPVA